MNDYFFSRKCQRIIPTAPPPECPCAGGGLVALLLAGSAEQAAAPDVVARALRRARLLENPRESWRIPENL